MLNKAKMGTTKFCKFPVFLLRLTMTDKYAKILKLNKFPDEEYSLARFNDASRLFSSLHQVRQYCMSYDNFICKV